MDYLNLKTGEVLTREEVLKQAKEEYPMLDPTNGIDLFVEHYMEIDDDG